MGVIKTVVLIGRRYNNIGFNNYEIIDDYVILYIHRRNGEQLSTKISIDKLDKAKKLNIRWYATWNDTAKSFYAKGTEYLGYVDGKPKYTTHYLHRILVNAKDNEEVDHRNFDTLDNRDFNLRVTNKSKNCKHKHGKHSNNTSGYRNVSWIESYKKWCVQLQVDGKNTMLGKFDDVHEAGKFAGQMREKYYGEFAGIN